MLMQRETIFRAIDCEFGFQGFDATWFGDQTTPNRFRVVVETPYRFVVATNGAEKKNEIQVITNARSIKSGIYSEDKQGILMQQFALKELHPFKSYMFRLPPINFHLLVSKN
uniref:Uncharacterized protein n=1 Tax=Romanomermis culicivorax TaxID=13658 RepID=A0A915JQG8_ROMCU